MATKLSTGAFAKEKIIEAALKWVQDPSSAIELYAAVDAFKSSVWEVSCYERLEPDENFFVLMARDPDFQMSIRQWAFGRNMQIETGTRKNLPEERAQITQALNDGRDGAQWRDEYLWRKKKIDENIEFDNDGYLLTGEHRRRQTTTSGHDIPQKIIDRLPTRESVGTEVEKE